jgi:hypothetical protein
LINFANPSGTITNSDLELADTDAQQDVLAQSADIREATIHDSSDNVVTLLWKWKGATSTKGTAAHLVCLQALHQWHHRYVPLFYHIPETANAVKKYCSRLW